MLFQSTRPVWGATLPDLRPEPFLGNFNPRAPCGARQTSRGSACLQLHFNPRAPCGARRHTGGDVRGADAISIHAPRVGRDACSPWTLHEQAIFQSTRPVWGATQTGFADTACERFQSTRPVWGATNARQRPASRSHFNPRAPCGARPRIACHITAKIYFNPRAPCGARPSAFRSKSSPNSNFNPRAPCGARLSCTER